MILTEKENTILKDLQTQEKVCMEHYNLCASTAKDGCLKDLFTQIAKDEQDHYQFLGQLMDGQMPSYKTADSAASKADSYQPKAAYSAGSTRQINSMTRSFVLTASEMKKWYLRIITQTCSISATAKCAGS